MGNFSHRSPSAAPSGQNALYTHFQYTFTYPHAILFGLVGGLDAHRVENNELIRFLPNSALSTPNFVSATTAPHSDTRRHVCRW